MRDRIKVLLPDGADRSELAGALEQRFEVEFVALSDAAGVAALSDATAFVDVDLSNAAHLGRLRRLLPKRGAFHRVMAINPRSRSERVQAGIFGATSLVSRPWHLLDVVVEIEKAAASVRTRDEGDASAIGTLERGMGRGEVPADAPGRSSILVVENLLADLFSACVDGGSVDGSALAEAGSHVAEAIPEVGFERWMETVRRHHGGTYQHCMLVTGMAVGFGTHLGMSTSDVACLAQAGLAHDVGKARVPIDLLDKPGKLSAEEFATVKMHSRWGHEAFLAGGRPLEASVLHGVLHHHEALDGSGYPDGLSGNAIPDLTRLVTICDIYGALSERRSYKPQLDHARVMEIMHSMADDGKIEKALVHALDWVVGDERPPAAVAPRRRRRA